MKSFLLIVFFINILYGCVEMESQAEPEVFIFNNNVLMDTTYFKLFKNGQFEEVVELWNKEKNEVSKSNITFDSKQALYYISLVEVDRKADLNKLLSGYDTHCYSTEYITTRDYVYKSCLLESMGPFMLEALLVYDFLNYQKYGLWNVDAYRKMSDISTNNNNIFREMETNFRHFARSDSNYYKFLKNEFPQWSYIDSVQKHVKIAVSYSQIDPD